MTNQQHPITVPPGSITGWKVDYRDSYHRGDLSETEYIALKSAQLGADQELEACCKIMEDNQDYVCGGVLRAIRRPKPPSEAEQALEDLDSLIWDLTNHCMGFKTTNIRRALESLKKLEQLND